MIDLKEIKKKIVVKKNIYFLFVVLTIFFLDRYTKLFILKNFNENTYYLNDYINFDLTWNIGVGFGLLSFNSSFMYNLITFVIISVILILIYTAIISENLEKLIFSIIIGGALGNLYDRLIYKAVPDFIDLHYNNFHWFVFNVADIFISIGIMAYLMKEILIKKK